MTKRLVIAGTHSGVGKTTITAGIIAALRRRQLTVQPFKVGPDYIDPTYHSLAANRPCHNLDSWMVPPQRIAPLFSLHAAHCDVAVIEGVMGLFDGSNYDDETGSTAQIAKLLAAPVVVVIDAARLARSAAAVAIGYCGFDPELPIAGFIVNRVGSERHGQGVARAIENATGKPVFANLAASRNARLTLAERHFRAEFPPSNQGRGTGFSKPRPTPFRNILTWMATRLLAVAEDVPAIAAESLNSTPFNLPPLEHRPVIAVARDEAFHFTYEENLELLTAAGAELAFFSPLHDAHLPINTSGILLSGGFPEVYAAQLAANTAMHNELRRFHASGMPIYAECGGLMYLTEAIVDGEHHRYPMVGLLPGEAVMGQKLSLGYRFATATQDGWFLKSGETLRGHEFHYSIWNGRPTNLSPAYNVTTAQGTVPPREEGACVKNLWASYVHVHFWSKPEIAPRMVEACRAFELASKKQTNTPALTPTGS